jgi:hypothetical protein
MSGALGKSGWAVGARTVGAPYGARYTISHNRMPLDRIPLCTPAVVMDRIDYPLSAIRFSLLQLIIPGESVASDQRACGGRAPASSRVGLRALVVLQPRLSNGVDPLPSCVQLVAPHKQG